MCVESVDSGSIDIEETFEFEQNEEQVWNGRTVQRQHHLSIFKAFSENLSAPFSSDVICLKGTVGASASADTDGNKEIEAYVKASNESSSISVEVKGSVSQDPSGNVYGKVETGAEIKF